MKNKKLITLITLLCVSFPSVVFADVNEDVKKAQEEYQVYQSKIDDLTGDVISLNCVIGEYLEDIDSNTSKIKSLDRQIEASEISIQKLKQDIEHREEIKDSRLREMYKSGQGISYISLIVSSKSLGEMISNIENVSKIMEIDREIIISIEEDKKTVANEMAQQEDDKLQVLALNLETEKKLKTVESKKEEQQGILNALKIEQETFGKEVLEVAERQLIITQTDAIKASNPSVSSLVSAVSQLQAVRDNQIESESVKSDIDSMISDANSKIESLRVVNGATVSDVNRGSVNATGNDIVDYAYQFLGKEYVWGAVGPDVFDCSGLTSYVYRHAANLEISRTTYTQINVGVSVSEGELQPGDLVFTYDNEHVGIYVGGGMYINATYPGSTVRVTPVTNFYAARRYL